MQSLFAVAKTFLLLRRLRGLASTLSLLRVTWSRRRAHLSAAAPHALVADLERDIAVEGAVALTRDDCYA